MKERLVEFLACPDCAADLRLSRVGERDAGEILDGELSCSGCSRVFGIVRGVPRLLPLDLDHLSAEVAEGFGWEWNQFDEIRPEYRQQFLDWIAPLSPEGFVGKRVLEGGCGKGRHSRLAAEFGATDVFAVDLGAAVEAAYRNTRGLDAVHVIQGSITSLPLSRCADLAFSVGVLHHLPDPAAGWKALVDHVAPGGHVAAWVYGYEGNEWIVHVVDPVRKTLTARLPHGLLYELSKPLGWLVAGAAKGVYRPLSSLSPALHKKLVNAEYLTSIAHMPTREIHTIVFDQLVTPVAYYLKKGEVEAWLRDARLADGTVETLRNYSWRAHADVIA